MVAAVHPPRLERTLQGFRNRGLSLVVIDTARRLKMLAVQHDTTLQALGEEAFEALLERYGGLTGHHSERESQ